MATPMRFHTNKLLARRRAALAAANRKTPTAPGTTVAAGLETLRGAPELIRTALESHRNALAEAHQQAASDPGLNEQGRAEQIGERRRHAEQQSAAEAAGLRDNLSQAASAVAAHAAAARPKPAAGVEALMARQIMWNRVRDQLDAGVPLDEVIGGTTDPEALHALHDELPAYLRIKDFAPESRANVLRSVDDQLAHVAGGRALATHTAAREAEQHVARLTPLLDHLDQVATGKAPAGSGMVAVIRAEHAARQTGTGAVPSTDAGPAA